jgi:hypothetical protein
MLSLSATAAMTGGPRKNFIEGFSKTCVRNQSAALINSGATPKMVRQYGSCSSTYIADLLNNQLVSEIEQGRIKFDSQWSEMAATYCRINFNRY